MKEDDKLTGTQGLIGGAVFTILVLLTAGFIKLPQNDVSLGTKYAEVKDIRDVAICEYKFDDNDIAKDSCQEYVKSKYYFGGYRCNEDGCNEHYAGYEWAEEQNIVHEEDCTGKSDSYIEGCKVFVEESNL